LISEVIGQKGGNGAFVFGAYSFLDKLSNGLVLFFLLKSSYFENNDPTFIRWSIVVIPCAACFIALIFILIGKGLFYYLFKEFIMIFF